MDKKATEETRFSSAHAKERHEKGEVIQLKEVVSYQDERITLFKDKVLHPNGQEGTHLRLKWNKPVGAVILPVLDNGDIVLLNVYRYPVQMWSIEIPRGGGEQGETSLMTASRELAEETGLEAAEFISLGVMFPESGIIDAVVELFLARGCRYATNRDVSSIEAIQKVVYKPYKEVLALAMEGQIKDGFTLATLLRARKYLV